MLNFSYNLILWNIRTSGSNSLIWHQKTPKPNMSKRSIILLLTFNKFEERYVCCYLVVLCRIRALYWIVCYMWKILKLFLRTEIDLVNFYHQNIRPIYCMRNLNFFASIFNIKTSEFFTGLKSSLLSNVSIWTKRKKLNRFDFFKNYPKTGF